MAIDAAIDIPIIVYNIPPRSVVDISVETMDRMFRDGRNIKGVKDATGNLARPAQQRMVSGPGFVQLSGEDATAIGFNAQGGVGCISVTSNVAPRLVSEFQAAMAKGDYAAALALQDKLMPLHRAMFLEPNPAGPKYLASLLGKMKNELRLPLVEASAPVRAELEAAAKFAGIL